MIFKQYTFNVTLAAVFFAISLSAAPITYVYAEPEEIKFAAVTHNQTRHVIRKKILHIFQKEETDTNVSATSEENILTTDEQKAIALIYNDEALTTRVPCSDEEFLLLCKLVQAECYEDDYIGKRMVAEVVINRSLDKRFSDGTIKSAIFQESQFQPVISGIIWNQEISNITKKAVSEALFTQCFDEHMLYFKSNGYFENENLENYLCVRGNYFSIEK